MGFGESLKTVNSLARTLIALAAVGLVGVGGWLGYAAWHAPEQAIKAKEAELAEKEAELATATSELSAARRKVTAQQSEITGLEETVAIKDLEIEAKDAEIEKISTALKLLKVDHRIAQLTVLEQGKRPDSDETYTKVRFVEVNDEDAPIDEPKEFELQGNTIFVDYWVVTFDDRYVEEADLDRSTAICLFRRVFDEVGGPQKGHQLDKIGSRPNAYARGGKMSPFEEKIWEDFWNIANDPERARQLGIRAAHGKAPYIQVREGMTYRLLLRSSGGFSITPGEGRPPEPAKE
jgi:hypothetical protein